ncbi:MAG: DUF4275 family protein [Ruminococcaceae bacterium]|nr:DUF4275 family protein [Oscillospiraceae bacterium]
MGGIFIMNDRELIEKWLLVFGKDIDKDLIDTYVIGEGAFLWHLFTWGKVSCLKGNAAKKTFDKLQYTKAIRFYGGYSNRIEGVSLIEKISSKEVKQDPKSDVYIVAEDFSWTYVRTHECDLGPYLCIKSEELGYLKFKYAKH